MSCNTSKVCIVKELYKKYSKVVLNFFRRRMLSHEDAEELTQETFLRLLERGSIEKIPPKNQKSYLLKCAKNRFNEYVRKEQRNRDMVHRTKIRELYKQEPSDHELERFFIEGEIVDTLFDSINSNADDLQKEIIDRKFYREEDYRTICRETKISRYQLDKMLRKLWCTVREKITRYYH